MLVIGVGNELRGDDGAGLAVARRLARGTRPTGSRCVEQQGEPIDAAGRRWAGADAVVIVDAIALRRAGRHDPPGRRDRRAVSPRAARDASTHAIGLGDAIELARTLGRLPARIVVHAVEGRRFDAGIGLSVEIEAAVIALADAVLHDARTLAAACGRRSTDADSLAGRQPGR